MTATIVDFTTATPSEIDTEIAAIHAESAPLYAEVLRIADRVTRIQRDCNAGRSWYTEQDVDTAKENLATARATVNRCLAQARPHNEEFRNRGGWTRAFIVAGGHVHSSQDCSSCHKGKQATQFGWLPELSGHAEAEIVDLAGDRACTICYPTAPVLTAGPSRLFHADEVAKEVARTERADKAAAKAAKAALTAIRPVRHSYQVIDTISKAKQYLTSAAGWNTLGYVHPSYPVTEVLDVIASLADKTGDSPESIVTAALKRYASRK